MLTVLAPLWCSGTIFGCFWIGGPYGLQKIGFSCTLGLVKTLLFHWDLRNCRSRKPKIVDLFDTGAFWDTMRYIAWWYIIFILNLKLGVCSFFNCCTINMPAAFHSRLGHCMATLLPKAIYLLMIVTYLLMSVRSGNPEIAWKLVLQVTSTSTRRNMSQYCSTW